MLHHLPRHADVVGDLVDLVTLLVPAQEAGAAQAVNGRVERVAALALAIGTLSTLASVASSMACYDGSVLKIRGPTSDVRGLLPRLRYRAWVHIKAMPGGQPIGRNVPARVVWADCWVAESNSLEC